MKKLLVVALALGLVVAFCGLAAAEYKATMKLACTQSMDHPYMLGAKKFADTIKEKTNGRIEIKLYPSNQLGKGEREMVEGMQPGDHRPVVTSTGPLGRLQPLHQHLDFPFLFRDNTMWTRSWTAHRPQVAGRHGKGPGEGLAFWEKRLPAPDQLQGRTSRGR